MDNNLPNEYVTALNEKHVVPLWPHLKEAMPLKRPSVTSKACIWRYEQIRPLLMQAGELVPLEKAGRRALVYCDPGRGDAMQVSATIDITVQLLLPNEKTSTHRHTANAARIVIEGTGAFTQIEGQTCPMEKGDLILTPHGAWHRHWHTGTEPVVWMDVLDLPVVSYLESSWSEIMEEPINETTDEASEVEYLEAGVLPMGRRRPLLRFPWSRAKHALRALAERVPRQSQIEIAYVNPENGLDPFGTLGFRAVMLLPKSNTAPIQRTSSAIFNVVEGSGHSAVDDLKFQWAAGDTFSVPPHAKVEHEVTNDTPAFLICVDDGPLHRRLGLDEECRMQ